MTKYLIPESNLPKLENEMKALENKIKKYGGNFSYKVLGEQFKEVELYGELKKVLFFEIEVEGELKFNDWEYCASIENTDEGNIIVSKDGGHEIPETYYYSAPKCDHCNSNRYRRFTYIIRNSKTGEYKQVGKGCLEDYTKGLSASAIAQLAEFFKTIEKISKDRSNEIYYEETEKLLIALQAYLDKNNFKYYKELKGFSEKYIGDRELRIDYNSARYPYVPCKNTWTPKKVKTGYTPKKFYDDFISRIIVIADEKLDTYKNRFNKAKEYYASQADDKGNDFHNYKTLIAQEEIPFEDVGILCNGFIEYLSTEDYLEEDIKKCNELREEFLEKEAKRKIEFDINLLKTVKELKSYKSDEDLEGKYVNITIVKRIQIKKRYLSDKNYYVDSNGNIYEIYNRLLDDVDFDKYVLIKNLRIKGKETETIDWFYDEIDEDTTITYYTTTTINEDEYNPWSKEITKAENTDKIIHEIYNSRHELLGEPDILNDYAGNINDIVTAEIKEGLKEITKSSRGAILYEGVDEKGRVYGVWSKKPITEVNVPVVLVGKVWKQNYYRGRKSTLVNVEKLEVI